MKEVSVGLMMASEFIMPFVIVSIVMYGMYKKIAVYDVFIEGTKKGFQTVLQIMPTLVGLMVAVGVLRTSGFLEFLSGLLSVVMGWIGVPIELLPLFVAKMFSSSAATGLLLDIYEEYGVDSRLGTIASVALSSTETIFYTMSVYFMSVKVTKTRWTLAGALVATVAGIVASVRLGTLF